MPKVLSLFTGAGGLDLGLRSAGFEVAAAVELEPWACETLRLNHPDLKVFGPPEWSGDIRDLDDNLLKEFLGPEYSEIDVVVGGPPCQPFSTAAMQRFLKTDSKYKRNGFNDHNRGTLLHEFIRIVIAIKPKAFLIENVPGLIKGDNRIVVENLTDCLKQIGYTISSKVLLASDYGVPQDRERAFIIGHLQHADIKQLFPSSTHSEEQTNGCVRKMSVADALHNMPADLPNHVTRNHLQSSVARYKRLSFGQRDKSGRVDRLDPNRPSKTVIAGGKSGGGRSHLHPFEARTLSPRECARLQTFPDDYLFCGTMGRQFTQIGNAVPPLMGEVLGKHILRCLFPDFGHSEKFCHRLYLSESMSSEETFEYFLSRSNKMLAYSDMTKAFEVEPSNLVQLGEQGA